MRLIPHAATSLARNATWILTGRLAAQGLLVLCTVLLARRLGLTGFGGYAVLVSVVSLANVATTFGTDMVLVREIAGGGRVDRGLDVRREDAGAGRRRDDEDRLGGRAGSEQEREGNGGESLQHASPQASGRPRVA